VIPHVSGLITRLWKWCIPRCQGEPDKRFNIICGTCGSANVSRDAWGDWDTGQQQWVLRTVFDYAYCHDCDGETRLEEVPLAGSCG
jgi:hypothetical protein